MMVATLGQEEVEIPSVSQRKMVRSIAICVVQVYLSGLPLLERSIQLSPAAELSGKDHEDSSHTVVIAVVHWYLPWDKTVSEVIFPWHTHSGLF